MKNRNAFTLVEILAVIVILGILLIIAVPMASKYIEQSEKKSFYVSVANIVNSIKTENIINDNDYCMYNYNEDKENKTDLINSMYVLIHQEDGKKIYSVYAKKSENTIDIDTYNFNNIDMNEESSWIQSFDNSYSKFVVKLSDKNSILELQNYKICSLGDN